MGKLGYQSEAQASIAASFNSLEDYATSLEKALTQNYPDYEKIGVRNLGGEYNQLATSLLQIENEYYGSIRPKRTIRSGERPLHALRERGVEYIEVRCLDLDPFIKIGIDENTSRFVDMFLLLCHLQESPPDSPSEIAELAENQHLVASRGREPGLQLSKNGQAIELQTWVQAILSDCQAIAKTLDQDAATGPYQATLQSLQDLASQPDNLPSARVLNSIQTQFNGSFNEFTLAQSEQTKSYFQSQSLNDDLTTHFSSMASQSLLDQKAIEKADSMDFEQYRLIYTDPKNLQV
jgi:glutamate--cysteine ligase